MWIFDLENLCKYSKTCSGYRKDSDTCMKALDKRYCGLWKRFEGVENNAH